MTWIYFIFKNVIKLIAISTSSWEFRRLLESSVWNADHQHQSLPLFLALSGAEKVDAFFLFGSHMMRHVYQVMLVWTNYYWECIFVWGTSCLEHFLFELLLSTNFAVWTQCLQDMSMNSTCLIMALLFSYKLSLYVLWMDPLTCNATFRSHFRAFPGIGWCLETFCLL